MRKYIIFALTVILFISMGLNVFLLHENFANRSTYIKITKYEEAYKILTDDESGYVRIDLRDEKDFTAGHIKNSANFPYEDKHKEFVNM